jgi:hypothetical protein
MRTAIGLFTAASMGLVLGTSGALAQSAGPDEAVAPNGAVTQQHAFTAGQKNAIYNAISRQKVRPPADRIAATVGAPVPPSTELLDLPDRAGGDGDSVAVDYSRTGVLKYAFVENQVVIVDPVAMRVVDVIHGSVRP